MSNIETYCGCFITNAGRLMARYQFPNSAETFTRDVSHLCLQFLLEPVEWQNPTLGSLVKLMELNPLAVLALGATKSDYVQRCIDAAEWACVPFGNPGDYLLLEPFDEFNTQTGELVSLHNYSLSGRFKKGSQMQPFGMLDIPIGELLDLPIRISTKVSVQESNAQEQGWGDELRRYSFFRPRLVDLINASFQDYGVEAANRTRAA